MYSNYPRNDGISLSIIPFFFCYYYFPLVTINKAERLFFFSSNIYRNSAIIKARTKFLRVYFALPLSTVHLRFFMFVRLINVGSIYVVINRDASLRR